MASRMRDDEEYSRLLAAEEEREREREHYEYDDDIEFIPQPRASDVQWRHNLLVRLNVMVQTTGATRNPVLEACFSLFWALPQIAAIIWFGCVHYVPKSCDQPLTIWALVDGIFIMTTLITSLCVFCCGAGTTSRKASLYTFQRVRLLHAIWFAIGMYFFISTHTCSQDAHDIYWLCVGLLVVHALDFLKPLIAFVCLIPIALLCLPCVIRLVSMLPASEEASTRGVTRERITDEIPKVVYKAGMFGGEEQTCPICLMVYEDGDELRCLRCLKTHHFHANCLDHWLVRSNTCPTCRSLVIGGSGGLTQANVGNEADAKV